MNNNMMRDEDDNEPTYDNVMVLCRKDIKDASIDDLIDKINSVSISNMVERKMVDSAIDDLVMQLKGSGITTYSISILPNMKTLILSETQLSDLEKQIENQNIIYQRAPGQHLGMSDSKPFKLANLYVDPKLTILVSPGFVMILKENKRITFVNKGTKVVKYNSVDKTKYDEFLMRI